MQTMLAVAPTDRATPPAAMAAAIDRVAKVLRAAVPADKAQTRAGPEAQAVALARQAPRTRRQPMANSLAVASALAANRAALPPAVASAPAVSRAADRPAANSPSPVTLRKAP